MEEQEPRGFDMLEMNYSRFVQDLTQEIHEAMDGGKIVKAEHHCDDLDASLDFIVVMPNKKMFFRLSRETILQQ